MSLAPSFPDSFEARLDRVRARAQGAARRAVAERVGAGAALLAAVAAPLFLVGVVPLADFPAHLARLTLLSHLPLDPRQAEAWEVAFRPVPNLAMDLFVPFIAPWVGPEVGLKLFMTLGLALWLTGAALIWRGLWREASWQPLYAMFFALNATFYYGFGNFHLGVGLALTAAGVWLNARRRGPLLLAAMALATLALLICHLMAVAILCLLIAGFEAGALWRDRAGPARVARSVAEIAAVFLPAALIWGFGFEHGHGTGVEFKWTQNLLGLFLYSSGAGAIRYNALPAAAMLAAFGLAWRFGRLRVAQQALPALALMTLAMLLCPAVAISGSIIHVRLPAVVAVLLLTSARLDLDPRWTRPALTGLVAAALLCGGLEVARWRGGSQTLADMRAAARAHVPEGARIMLAMADPAELGLTHAADLVAVDRKGFSATFFTLRGQSTVLVKPAFERIASLDTLEGGAPSFADAMRLLGASRPNLTPVEQRQMRPYLDMACDFDYLLVAGAVPDAAPLPAVLQRVASGAGFALFRIAAPMETGCWGLRGALP